MTPDKEFVTFWSLRHGEVVYASPDSTLAGHIHKLTPSFWIVYWEDGTTTTHVFEKPDVQRKCRNDGVIGYYVDPITWANFDRWAIESQLKSIPLWGK